MNNPGGPPQGYPPPGGGYHPQAPGYPPPPGYSPQQSGYPPHPQGYPPPHGSSTSHGAYPPQQPGFPPPQGYSPQGQWGGPSNEPITPERGHLLSTFVGQNHQYYLSKWHEMDAKRSQSSFNVAAFFLSVFWLIYRKMYVLGLSLLGGFLLLTVLSTFVGNMLVSNLISLMGLGVAIYIGLMGNSLYRKHAEAAVSRSGMYPDPNARMHMLHQQGGTNIGAALGVAGGYLLIVILLVFMVL